MSRSAVGTALEVGGSLAVTAGSAMLAVALGWIVGGALCLVFAWRLAR